MGVLGEYEPEEMLRKLDAEVAAWTKADPTTPGATGAAPDRRRRAGCAGQGRALPPAHGLGAHRARRRARRQAQRAGLSRRAGRAVEPARRAAAPRADSSSRPNFHLGIDPEFSMKDGTPPGRKVGTYDAADVNYASGFLADLVTQYSLPPKVLVVHRFTQHGVTNTKKITLDPRVQIVMDMDGFGPPDLKRNTFRKWIKAEPVQFAGWKQFYKPRNDSPRTTIARNPEAASPAGLHPVPVSRRSATHCRYGQNPDEYRSAPANRLLHHPDRRRARIHQRHVPAVPVRRVAERPAPREEIEQRVRRASSAPSRCARGSRAASASDSPSSPCRSGSRSCSTTCPSGACRARASPA